MIPRDTYHALPDTSLRQPRGLSLRPLRHVRRTATRLLRRHLMHQPVTAHPHDEAVDADEPDCLAWLPDDETLLVYDPASESGGAWLFTDDPIDLREYA